MYFRVIVPHNSKSFTLQAQSLLQNERYYVLMNVVKQASSAIEITMTQSPDDYN